MRFSIVIGLLLAIGVGAQAQDVLRLNRALELAQQNNRQLLNAALDVEAAEDTIAATRTRRLPNFDLQVRAAQLVTPVKMTFPAGSFGSYPGIGPIPGIDTTIESATEPAGYVNATVAQPLTQLHKIGLSVKMSSLSRDMDREKLRSQQASVASDVKALYYSILQTESALDASLESIKLYKEASRVVVQYVSLETALKSDGIDAATRLAGEEYRALGLKNALATQKEQMNVLLGRDVRTDFTLAEPVEPTSLEMDLAAAQARALDRRAELREARLAVELADTDRRVKKAELIPDVSLAFMYSSFVNVDLLPQSVGMVGLEVKWEPFDWGRKGKELAAKTRAVDQAKLNAIEATNRVLVEVANAFRKVEESRALVAVRSLSRDSAKEKLRVALNRERERSALVKDVLQAQATHADANAQYREALMSLLTAQAEFQKAIGEEE